MSMSDSQNITASTNSDLPLSAPTSHSTPTNTLSDTIRTLLPVLRGQSHHYMTAYVHGHPYLITPGDTVRLPFHMPNVRPGDVLRLTRASNIGSRDYTLEGTPYIDEQLFECRALVLGTEAEPMRTKEKTKRRQRRVKKVKSKHKYTILKIREIKIRALEEIEGGDVKVESEILTSGA